MEGHFDVDGLLLSPGRDLLTELSRLQGHWSGKGQEVSYERGELPPVEVEPSDKPLGRGAAGSVFKVVWTHPKTQKQINFAEKRVSPSKNFPRELVKFEVTLLKKLQHRHIVSFIGSYEQNHIFHILILPCATCDLARLLDDLDKARGQASPESYFHELGWINPTSSADGEYFQRHARERLGKLCGCITNAVLYLHDKKIRHKDIKPSNILLDRDSVYLTDFGVSKDFEEQDTTQTIGSVVHGTASYLAPEIVRGELRGSKADIYSLGLVFMEIFTFLSGHSRQDMFTALGYGKRQPFVDKNEINRYSSLRVAWAAYLLRPVELESKLGTRDLLLGMLHLDPSQRPEAYEVASQLATLDPDGKLHGECCQPHNGSVGFKALIAKYDDLREQHDQLFNRYEAINKDLEECRSERDSHKAELDELKAKWESARTIQRPATPGGRATSDTITNPWSTGTIASRLQKSSHSNLSNSSLSEMNEGHRGGAGLSWRQEQSLAPSQNTVRRNRNQNRIDTEAISFSADWTDSKRRIWNEMKNLNLCRFDYLAPRGCSSADCPYVHEEDHAITEPKRDVFRAFVRKQPCTNGTSCSYEGCIFGHHCLDNNYPCDFMRNGKKCPFPRELHIRDFNVVTTTVVK